MISRVVNLNGGDLILTLEIETLDMPWILTIISDQSSALILDFTYFQY